MKLVVGIDALVVVIDRNRKCLLRIFLTNDVFIQ